MISTPRPGFSVTDVSLNTAAGNQLVLRCSGCGTELSATTTTPFVCPRASADDVVDHIIERHLPLRDAIDMSATHPFVRYRSRLASFAVARAAGWSDQRFAELVHTLDAAVAATDGRATPAFKPTPWRALPQRVDLDVYAKLELRGIAGSHKARHLFGLMLWLQVQESTGALSHRPTLAIASCGNAALAAAVVARAARWPIDVFVPTDADPAVLARLRDLHARVQICPRQQNRAGDPTIQAFRAAVAAGALPFCCQGTDNGLAIEGGETLGWELAEDIAQTGGIDSLWVQVGGGALGTGCWRGLRDARQFSARDHGRGNLPRPMTPRPMTPRLMTPRLMTVQTTGAWPLGMAWARFVAELLDHPVAVDLTSHKQAATAPALAVEASAIWRADRAAAATGLAQGWSRYMTTWPTPPHSVAHGILDDETYDGRALVEAMLDSGGWPVVADESYLSAAANATAKNINVTATGAAGLAGLLQTHDRAPEHTVDRRHAVLLTGLDRSAVEAGEATPNPLM